MNLPLSQEQRAEIVKSLRRFAAEEPEAEWSEVRARFSDVCGGAFEICGASEFPLAHGKSLHIIALTKRKGG